MWASYTRLFADGNGVSHFEDLEVELVPGFATPPTEPLHFAAFEYLGQSNWVGAGSDWNGAVPHPVPRRMLVIVLQGSVEIAVGDGTVREFKRGDVILSEDTWGTGHSSRITSEEPSVSLFIEIAGDKGV